MANLTLRVTVKDGYLDVNESNNANHMPQGQSGTITWELVEDAATGSFNALDAANPGFAWKQQPPANIFGPAGLSNNNKQIQMSDSDLSSNSTGSWIYQLYATIDDTEYHTVWTPLAMQTTNPKIVNN